MARPCYLPVRDLAFVNTTSWQDGLGEQDVVSLLYGLNRSQSQVSKHEEGDT